MKLLDFQKQAVNNLLAKLLNGTADAVLLQSATASGKTVIAADYIKECIKKYKTYNILVLVNLQTCIPQFYDVFTAHGLDVSVLHDTIDRNLKGEMFECDYNKNILITMPETFLNTYNRSNKLFYDPNWIPDLILIDEAHKGTSTNYQIIKDLFSNSLILGLTATPFRQLSKEGEHLTEWYDELVTTISVRDLIKIGRLVQPRYYGYDSEAHYVDTWKKRTKGSKNKRTIFFTRDTTHSLAVKEAFVNAGISAEYITSGSDLNPDNIIYNQTLLQRQRIFNDFDSGNIDVLISVRALCEGFDSPKAKYCFIARNVGNHALYHQMIGRVLRADKEKDHAEIVDFGNSFDDYGPIEEYEWSLDAKEPKSYRLKACEITISQDLMDKRSAIFHHCVECHHVYDILKREKCIHCGTKHNIHKEATVGELLEAFNINNKIFQINKKSLPEFKARFKGMQSNLLGRIRFNEVYNADIFNPETGEVYEEFSYLEAIAKDHSIKWNDKVKVSLSK